MTTHTARRPKANARVVARRTTHGPVRQNDRTSAPVIAKAAANDEQPAPRAASVKPMRTVDSDDHLAAYFRQLAEHELLTPEDERELSQGIEDTEILTWERVFARPDIVRPVLALVIPNLEEPIQFPKLLKAADDLMKSKRARKDEKLVKKLAAASKETAAK